MISPNIWQWLEQFDFTVKTLHNLSFISLWCQFRFPVAYLFSPSHCREPGEQQTDEYAQC